MAVRKGRLVFFKLIIFNILLIDVGLFNILDEFFGFLSILAVIK